MLCAQYVLTILLTISWAVTNAAGALNKDLAVGTSAYLLFGSSMICRGLVGCRNRSKSNDECFSSLTRGTEAARDQELVILNMGIYSLITRL